MKENFYSVKVDELGRIILPQEILDMIELPDNSEVEISLDEQQDHIVIKKWGQGGVSYEEEEEDSDR